MQIWLGKYLTQWSLDERTAVGPYRWDSRFYDLGFDYLMLIEALSLMESALVDLVDLTILIEGISRLFIITVWLLC